MTTENKKGKVLLVLASSVLLLASCSTSEIKAKPTFYKDEIVDVEGDLTHNTMSVIFDALSDTSAYKEKVLERVLLALAEDYFGNYDDAKKYAAEATLSEEGKAFLAAHKFYSQTDDDDKAVYTEEEQVLKLKYFVKDVEKRINNEYYSLISGGSYSYRNRFSEKRFANYLKSQLYEVSELAPGAMYYDDILVTKAYKDDVSSILHLDIYKDYTDRNILKTVYKNLIVEEYMYSENYALLSRSNARKVNYVKLTQNSEYPAAARSLLIAYAERYIEGNGEGNLDYISEAWAGLPTMSAEAKQLLTDANFEVKNKTIDGVDYTYYPATSYGKLIEKYAKVTSDRYSSENESTFTGDNSYPKEVGFKMELDKIALEDYVTNEWYYKNGSNSLPSDVSSRLFEIGVANAVDHVGVTVDENGNVTHEEASVTYNAGDYVSKKNGSYWLVPSKSQKIDVDKYNYILTETGDTPSYYLVEVEEAVSTSKLSTNENNKSNYAHLRSGASLRAEDSLFTEEVAREIAKLYNTNDTYTKQAYVKVLKDSKIKYHDQSIYDYFKENYPDLFEDD